MELLFDIIKKQKIYELSQDIKVKKNKNKIFVSKKKQKIDKLYENIDILLPYDNYILTGMQKIKHRYIKLKRLYKKLLKELYGSQKNNKIMYQSRRNFANRRKRSKGRFI